MRIGARQAESDLGLALASLGVVLAGLREGPVPVRLPELATLNELMPPEHRPHAEAILATARGLVDWLADPTGRDPGGGHAGRLGLASCWTRRSGDR